MKILDMKADLDINSDHYFREIEAYLPAIPIGKYDYTDVGYRFRRNIF